MSNVTLAFGRHRQGGILHISEAQNGNSCHCVCPECDWPLVARTEHVTPHFAHKPGWSDNSDRTCATTGQMTALHIFARDLFLRGGRVYLPAVGQDGQLLRAETEVELNDVKTEVGLGGLQPDVTFTAAGRSLLMEIAVTHPVPASKASLIRRRKIEAFEIEIKQDGAYGNHSADWLECHVRQKAPRSWIFNAELEDHLHSLYDLGGVPPRGALNSERAKAFAASYDRAAERPKVPVPTIASRKVAVAQWLRDTGPSFEVFFRTPAEDWRAFVLLDCLAGVGLPLNRILRQLKNAEHLTPELVSFSCSAIEAAEAGLPTFGAKACVYTFLSRLEMVGAVVCLSNGCWCRLFELSSQRPQPFGPPPVRPKRGELTAKRRNEVNAILDRIAAQLEPADQDEFASGIKAWWTRPLDQRQSPLEIIKVGNALWERLRRRLVAIDGGT